MYGIIRLSTPQKDEKNDGGKGCPKLFTLCVEYRTSVLLRGVSLLKVVENQIMHKTTPTSLPICSNVWKPQELTCCYVGEKEAGVSVLVVSIDLDRV